MFSQDTDFFLPLAYDEEAARVTSKHNLESYAYYIRNTANETINWLNASPNASKEEYEEKKAKLEMIAEYVCFLFVDTSIFQPYHT